MLESVVTIVYCIILIILSILFVKRAIFFFSNEEKFAGGMCICLSILTLFFSIYGGYKYYISQKRDFCPNCHYEYKTNEKFDYCPECNAKLTNKCSNCGKTLPDKFFDNATCPYCGAEIKPKVGEQPLSEGSSEQNAEKKNECPECHHSFEGMNYIKDICPFCGKEIN